jgi:predicted permease
MAKGLLQSLLPNVGQMCVIILIGYLSSRSKLVTPQNIVGMSRFVGTFCLPAMLFKALVRRVI